MQVIRNKVFETNSSSTHSLAMIGEQTNYLPKGDKIVVEFIDTNDYYHFSTLKEKISYLVSHIANHHKYNATDYADLIKQIKNDYEFKHLEQYVMERYNKVIDFPKTYAGDIEEIVNINHQLTESCLENVLDDLIKYSYNGLDIVLAPDKIIEIGTD